MGDFTFFNVEVLGSLIWRPPRYLDVIDQLDSEGTQSLAILSFTGLFIGLAITLILQSELDTFGAKVYIGRTLAVASIRELSPVFTALMLSGRVGARIAAELGSMCVTEQIESIESMGQDPMRKLVTPRLLALFIMAPALTVIVSLITILGGFIIATVDSHIFWFQVRKAFVMKNLIVGLVKPFIFSLVITSFACFLGLRVRGGVRAVGQATARAVVYSSVVIFLADYAISSIFLLVFNI
jgi:phospholipid/cholesterol/gamma-HCH transport system permease protein